jgi:hypothetical protein
MATRFWKRSTWTDAGQLVTLIDPDAGPGEAAGRSLPDWFAVLVAKDELSAALGFVAHALPRYECVTWAAQALLETGAAERADPLVNAVLRWIDNPEDATRRAAATMAEAVRQPTPERLLALAVFFSGGSIAPPDLAAVQPAPDICARMAAAAVLVGAQRLPAPAGALRTALALGEAMARGD